MIIVHGDPTTLHPKIWDHDHQFPRIDDYAIDVQLYSHVHFGRSAVSNAFVLCCFDNDPDRLDYVLF